MIMPEAYEKVRTGSPNDRHARGPPTDAWPGISRAATVVPSEHQICHSSSGLSSLKMNIVDIETDIR